MYDLDNHGSGSGLPLRVLSRIKRQMTAETWNVPQVCGMHTVTRLTPLTPHPRLGTVGRAGRLVPRDQYTGHYGVAGGCDGRECRRGRRQ